MNRFVRTVYNLKILPRWVIIAIDLSFIALAALIGYLLRFNFSIGDIIKNDFFTGIILQVACGLVSILISNSYKGIIRYTGLQDGVRIFYMLMLNLTLVAGSNLIYFYNIRINLIPYSVIFISFLASFLFLFNYRLLVKYV